MHAEGTRDVGGVFDYLWHNRETRNPIRFIVTFRLSKRACMHEERHLYYNAATVDIERIHAEVGYFLPTITLEIPDKLTSYTIPVTIYERKVGNSDHKLTIEIVEGKETE